MIEEKKSVALSSVVAALFLTGTKLTVGILTGSLGILSEAAHSGLDLLAAVMTWFAVTVSDRPADSDHPYGHEKIENLSALFETLLLLITCAWIIYEAVHRLFFKSVEIEVTWWSYGVVVLAIVIDFSRSRALYRVAKKTHSPALEADALHFSSDIGSSAVVLLGLLMTQLGYPAADAIAALGVSLFVIWISWRLGKKAVDKLVDRVSLDHVERATKAALSVPGVKRAYNVRVREAGAKHFVDLKIGLDKGVPFFSAHEATEGVEKAIKQVFRQADVLVHPEPEHQQARGLAEEVIFLAQRAGAGMHDLMVHETSGGLQVDVHLEFPPEMPLSEAHGRGTGVEESLRAAFPQLEVVHTHLECLGERPEACADVTAGNEESVAAIRRVAEAERNIKACREVRILEGDGRWLVRLTCALDHGCSLGEAHAVASAVEERVLELSSRITSVSVHTEPEEV